MHQAPLVHREPAREFLGGRPLAEPADVQDERMEHLPRRALAECQDGAVQHPGQALEAVFRVVVRGWVWRWLGRRVHGRRLAVGWWARGRYWLRGRCGLVRRGLGRLLRRGVVGGGPRVGRFRRGFAWLVAVTGSRGVSARRWDRRRFTGDGFRGGASAVAAGGVAHPVRVHRPGNRLALPNRGV